MYEHKNRIGLAGIVISLVIVCRLSDAVVEIGQVKCILILNFTEGYYEARRICLEKMKTELEAEYRKGKRFPHNAADEEFEWDDKCSEYCAYQEAGILDKGADKLPDKSLTEQLFKNEKVGVKYYEQITAAWNDCLEISGTISKAKEFDKCKTITHHRHCFNRKSFEIMQNAMVEC